MEKLKEAKDKAENFLFRVVKSIGDGILKNEEGILEPFGEEELSLRFEAHAYLCI